MKYLNIAVAMFRYFWLIGVSYLSRVLRIFGFLCCIYGCQESEKPAFFLPELVDSVLLYNPANIPIALDYDVRDSLFLVENDQKPDLYIYSSEGVLMDTLKMVTEGPEAVDNRITSIFDEEGNIAILTKSAIHRFSRQGKELGRCALGYNAYLSRGDFNPRMDVWKDTIILALFDDKDREFEESSIEFVEKSHPLKILSAHSPCSILTEVPFPRDCVFRKGMYQTIFYEPLISVDSIHQEIEVLYVVDPSIYIYDLKTLRYKDKIDISVPEEMKFPKPVEWGKREKLLSRFYSDFELSRFVSILNVDGITIVGYKREEENPHNGGDIIYYIVLDDAGNVLGEFEITDKSIFSHILFPGPGNTVWAWPNADLWTSEPEGLPLYKLRTPWLK